MHGLRSWVSYYEYPAYFGDWNTSDPDVPVRHLDRTFNDYSDLKLGEENYSFKICETLPELRHNMFEINIVQSREVGKPKYQQGDSFSFDYFV